MRVLSWLFKGLLFLLALGFALTNQDIATLRFFGLSNFEWRAPLVIFLLVFFAAGAVLGLISVVPTLFRHRREISRLRKEVQLAARNAAAGAQTVTQVTPTADVTAATAARLGV